MPNLPETLYYIDARNHPTRFFAGVVIGPRGYVVAAANIIRYMERDRWTLSEVRSYCRKKKWKFERIHTVSE